MTIKSYVVTHCMYLLLCRLFSLEQKYNNKVKLSVVAYGGLLKAIAIHQQELPSYGDALPDWVSHHVIPF